MNQFKNVFFLISNVCLLSLISNISYAQTTVSSLLQQSIDDKKCVGIAGGYSIENGAIQQDASGFRDLDKKLPFTTETITRVASISKPMTAVAILQLVEQNKIELDASIQTYLPDYPIHEKGTITVRNLLQHTAGIRAYQSKKERQNKKQYGTLSEATSIFKDSELINKPGESFNYSTYGYVVLGVIIEKVSGQTYEEYLQKNIWEKAGMTHTSVEDCRQNYEGKAALYHITEKGKIKSADMTNLSDRIPGGGIQSTVGDLLKFGDAILNETLISAETLLLMTADSGLKNEGSGYGMGWYLYGQAPNKGEVFGHTGAQIGCSAMFMLIPSKKTTVIAISNTSGAMQEVSNVAGVLINIAKVEWK